MSSSTTIIMVVGAVAAGGFALWWFTREPADNSSTINNGEACDFYAKGFLKRVNEPYSRFIEGQWTHVPRGCSVQSGGDWGVHYNTHPTGAALIDRPCYTMVNSAGTPDSIADAKTCEERGRARLSSIGQPFTRFVEGQWDSVPKGCSFQSGGDYGIHWNTHATGARASSTRLPCYTMVPTS